MLNQQNKIKKRDNNKVKIISIYPKDHKITTIYFSLYLETTFNNIEIANWVIRGNYAVATFSLCFFFGFLLYSIWPAAFSSGERKTW